MMALHENKETGRIAEWVGMEREGRRGRAGARKIGNDGDSMETRFHFPMTSEEIDRGG